MLPLPWDQQLDGVRAAVSAAWANGEEEQLLLWLEQLTPGDWARIDEGERRSWMWLPAVIPSAHQSTLADGWRSFAPDGRLREAAVRRLAHDLHPTAVGFLLLRCDDWVFAVAARAQAAVCDRIRTNAIDLQRWMPLILARDSRERGGDLASLCAAHFGPGIGAKLLNHNDLRTRRWACRQVLDEAPTADALQGLISASGDPLVARTLALAAAVNADDQQLSWLLHHRWAKVRAAAWEQVASDRLPEFDLRHGLCDPAPIVRRAAQQAARNRGLDAAAIYLSADCCSPSERRGRLLGLAEWGAPEALDIARSTLDDPAEAVRIAAIRVVALRMPDPAAVLLALLETRQGAEQSAVRKGLEARRVHVNDTALARLRAGNPDQRATAWQLGRMRGKWERLLAGLQASDDPHDSLATAAKADLASWHRSVMPHAGRPNPAQRAALEAALTASTFGSSAQTWVAFVLRT
jgi:hypothetical protein